MTTAGRQEGAGETPGRPPCDDVGALVIGAADGDHWAWEQLVAGYSDLVTSITAAHQLNETESAQVRAAVWHRLGLSLAKIRRPDRVGTWLGAVTRDECVKVRATAPLPPVSDPQ